MKRAQRRSTATPAVKTPRPEIEQARRPAKTIAPWIMVLMVALFIALLVWAVGSRRIPIFVALDVPVICLVTFAIYWRDKYAAERGFRRTSERTLHCFSLIGGWPGAWLAQRVLSHKSSKPSFQTAYRLSIVANLLLLAAWTVVT